MAGNFILDWTPGLDAAVLVYDRQEKRYELTLVDSSTREGQLKLALSKAGRNFIWCWQPIDWRYGPTH